MPTLNEYVPDSDKEGFYVVVNIGEPITLQVSLIAERIFNAVGYGDDDTVPCGTRVGNVSARYALYAHFD